MGSSVIHNIAGEKFLYVLENRYGVKLTENEKNQFLLGNLIVDSSKIKKDFPENATKEELKELKKKYRNLAQEEKIATHFRNSNDLELCIQTPKLSKFIDKYQSLFKGNLGIAKK